MEMSESLSNSGARNHRLIRALARLASIVPSLFQAYFLLPNVIVDRKRYIGQSSPLRREERDRRSDWKASTDKDRVAREALSSIWKTKETAGGLITIVCYLVE
jgi:hypothetical protein